MTAVPEQAALALRIRLMRSDISSTERAYAQLALNRIDQVHAIERHEMLVESAKAEVTT